MGVFTSTTYIFEINDLQGINEHWEAEKKTVEQTCVKQKKTIYI